MRRLPQVMAAAMPEAAEEALGRLLAYCRAENWAGYDPYDALNSNWLRVLPFLDSRLPRLALTQLLKRSPVNPRRWLLIPKRQNAKALGLFLAALLKLERAGVAGAGEEVESLFDRIRDLRSPGMEPWCWGYSFPWQTRTIIVPAGAPNLVCTVFVAEALLDYYEQKRLPEALEMAASAATFLRGLYWAEGGKAAFAYPQPAVHTPVYNANLIAAAFLGRVARHTGDASLLAPAMTAARYSAAAQMTDGSWHYGEGAKQRWIDNFHTGFNLCALRQLGDELRTDEFAAALSRGFQFYVARFLRPDGAVRYFHDRDWPVDAHCVAQSVLTLVKLRDLLPEGEALERARAVIGWALGRLWDPRGYFYYRAGRRTTARIPYMRWSQSWMLLALTVYVVAASRRRDDQRSLRLAMSGASA